MSKILNGNFQSILVTDTYHCPLKQSIVVICIMKQALLFET